MKTALKTLVITLLVFQQGFFLTAQAYNGYDGDDEITGYIQADLQPVRHGEKRIDQTEALETELETLRYYLSGMIYGFHFSYTPGDMARNIEEDFTIEVRADIPRGDANLKIYDTELNGDILTAYFRFRLLRHQIQWMKAWQSLDVEVSTGLGKGAFAEGPAVKIEAINDAMRESIRNHLRNINPNKPELIEGFIVIAENPDFFVDAGSYYARVKCALRIDTLQYYEDF